ncbi:hypoxia up-regulated protein 1-like isoform X1 [Oncorhynchus clarkii lewisi]|uniref:hypoxia up-regulated protein 1-like isoform X1 n=1 Tax=Oncorhynchus clarkii lewisi TaxID=490388 RepID=UPI0039B8945E
MRRKLTLWAPFCLVLALLPSQTASVAVMSVDLGSEWMKVAIVKPGVPMEIALNKESRRKTPIAVCLKENERLFGDSALGVSVKNPKFVYRHLQSLLGKKHDNPQVAVYQKRFPEHHLVTDESRGTVLFSNSEEMQYSPEELLGMVLNYSRGLAQDFAEQPIKDAVITVPVFFNQAERRAVLQAAQMACVKVLQLINDNTAVALNYGVFRRKDINSTAQNIMFYDMGSGSTTATIVTYQTVKTEESGSQPQLQIRGVGFDRSLGGFEMELRLQDHLAKLFNEQKKTKKDVRENHRAMAKLLKEAQRLKTVLSANAEFMAQVEGLLDDMDFKAKVTRVEFETLCADLFERVPGPVQDALSSAEMSLDEIEQVILVGGSTRVPKVQEVLLKAVGKEELGKNLNADEAAAMGAVYQAAALSKAFKVQPFLVREATVFPIQVEFTSEMEEDGSRILKHNKHILFQRMAPYPQSKVFTFNHTDDFAFNINYGDLSFLGQEDLSVFGSLNLTTVQLSGVGSSFQKHTDAEYKGINASFNMNESGVLLLDRVVSVFETVVEEEESTLTRGSSEPNTNVTEPVQDEKAHPESVKEQEEAAPQQEKQEPGEEQQQAEVAPTHEKTEGVDSKADLQDEKEGAKSGEEEKTTEEAAKTEAEKKAKHQKKNEIYEDVTVELQVKDILNPHLEAVTSSNKKLQDLTDRDLKKQEREKTLNSLEAFLFDTQDKMYQEEYQAVVLEEEKETILAKLSQVSTWMDEDGYSASTKELREKLRYLRKLCRDMFFRVEERRKWPGHLATLESKLNRSSFFLRSSKLVSEDDRIFTDVELKTLEKVINEISTWKNNTVAEQEKSSPTEQPVLLSKDIESKWALLDREVNYLLNKAAKPKAAKPKAAKPNNNSTTERSSSKANSSKMEEKVILPKEETKDEEGTEEVQQEEPPIKEPTGQNTDSLSQSQPTDKTASTEGTEEVQQEEPPIKEPTGQNTDSLSQLQPTDKTTRTEPTERNQSENHKGDEL